MTRPYLSTGEETREHPERGEHGQQEGRLTNMRSLQGDQRWEGSLLGSYDPLERPLVRLANAINRRTFLHRIGTATIALSAAGLATALDPEVAYADPTCPCQCQAHCAPNFCDPNCPSTDDVPPASIFCECLNSNFGNECPTDTTSGRSWYACPAKRTVQNKCDPCVGPPSACGGQPQAWARMYRDCCKPASWCDQPGWDTQVRSCDYSWKYTCHFRAGTGPIGGAYCSGTDRNYCVKHFCSSCVVCSSVGTC